MFWITVKRIVSKLLTNLETATPPQSLYLYIYLYILNQRNYLTKNFEMRARRKNYVFQTFKLYYLNVLSSKHINQCQILCHGIAILL